MPLGEASSKQPVNLSWLWSGLLICILSFLILYPVAPLGLGAFTQGNPAVGAAGDIGATAAFSILLLTVLIGGAQVLARSMRTPVGWH